MKSERILLGDDHALILDGIRKILADHCQVIGWADNGRTLVEEAARLRPDMVIMDVSMPILNGIEAAREIRSTLSSVKLIVLSMHSNAIYLRKALEAGASGYVLKSEASEELLKAINVVRDGGTYISPGFGPDVIDSVRGWGRRSAAVKSDLTIRQRQILQLIAEGKHNKEIAQIHNISVKTIEFHRGRLMAKLGCHSVAELTRIAISEGLIGGPK